MKKHPIARWVLHHAKWRENTRGKHRHVRCACAHVHVRQFRMDAGRRDFAARFPLSLWNPNPHRRLPSALRNDGALVLWAMLRARSLLSSARASVTSSVIERAASWPRRFSGRGIRGELAARGGVGVAARGADGAEQPTVAHALLERGDGSGRRGREPRRRRRRVVRQKVDLARRRGRPRRYGALSPTALVSRAVERGEARGHRISLPAFAPAARSHLRAPPPRRASVRDTSLGLRTIRTFVRPGSGARSCRRGASVAGRGSGRDG